MKIVISGKDSYIGNHLEAWLNEHCRDCSVEQLEVRDDSWKTYDFCGTDVVIHVAGIVHQPKLTDEGLYERVNVELPVSVAKKAKASGVRQFVFFSTMAVYGKEKSLSETVIDENTEIKPNSLYGASKYKAELELSTLASPNFVLSIVRPPNVYGHGCKGNYIGGFRKLARLPFPFPNAYGNLKQSMIYIDNLCEAIRGLIEDEKGGVFCPQDPIAFSAVELVRLIALAEGRKKHFSRFLGAFVGVFRWLPVVRKIYGGIEYSPKLSEQGRNYCVVGPEEGINRTINGG